MVFKHGTKKQIQVLCLAVPFSGRANKIFKLLKKKTPYPQSEPNTGICWGFFWCLQKKASLLIKLGLFEKSIHLSGLPQVTSKQRSLMKRKHVKRVVT